MPEKHRKPRRRLSAKNNDACTSRELFPLAKIATAQQWDDGLRRDLYRALVNEGEKEAIAARMVDVFQRRPELIPGGPPRQ